MAPINRPTRQAQPAPEPEVDEVLDDETEETEEPQGMRPKDLAEQLDISPKSLRAFLRREFPRGAEEKNTNWFLSDAQVDAAMKHFTPTEDETEESEEEVEA
jgi:uncharacterized protein YjcR